MTLRKLMLTSVSAAAFCAPMLASADSSSGTGFASADLDFTITIDDYLFLQIGSAGTTDLITFTIDGATSIAGNGTPIDGDQTVPVTLTANSENIEITADVSGATLTDGVSPDPIPWTDITISNATGTGDINPPVLDGATSSGTLNPNAAGGTLTDIWSFAYVNDKYFAPGTYGTGGAAGGAVVTFTTTSL
jgi:hypothetical protein